MEGRMTARLRERLTPDAAAPEVELGNGEPDPVPPFVPEPGGGDVESEKRDERDDGEEEGRDDGVVDVARVADDGGDDGAVDGDDDGGGDVVDVGDVDGEVDGGWDGEVEGVVDTSVFDVTVVSGDGIGSDVAVCCAVVSISVSVAVGDSEPP
jgi:hypothetical protein